MSTKAPISFDALDSAYDDDKIENGAWMDFIGPDGEPWQIEVDGKKYTVGAKVRSVLSTRYDRHLDQSQTGTANKIRKLKSEEQRRQVMMKELKADQPRSFSILVAEMRNISKKQLGAIAVPESDLLHFANITKNKKWVKQALEFAEDDSNYTPDSADGATSGNVEGADPAD